jgi:hypothetical protein
VRVGFGRGGVSPTHLFENVRKKMTKQKKEEKGNVDDQEVWDKRILWKKQRTAKTAAKSVCDDFAV